ncbi:hypothetical protein [Rhizobium ruizarguesonis]|uniref:hypothetical protein n=1 Tax=Rhizobium ruizarguesonis TaxID=2081791 RepID=UPI001CF2C05C|nr:hypothetical protein [Rhizobium ruizarguesonis]MCB2399351.1 hypothetical protein [Rhizobium ruizarguesonis]
MFHSVRILLVVIGAAAGANIVGSASAQVVPNRADALDFPAKHAWDLFLTLNHPALDPKLGVRGAPDPKKKIGDPGEVVWETWRAATPEVYTDDGRRPPDDYNDMSLVDTCPSGKVPEPPSKSDLADALSKGLNTTFKVSNIKGVHPMFNPADGVGGPDVTGFGETRMNKAAYDFILKNELYSFEGQQVYAASAIAASPDKLRNLQSLQFPADAIEVKAGWIVFTKDEVAQGLQNKYYSVNWNGNTFGLQTLHISTKDVPNWFWTTFHHKNVPGHEFNGGEEKDDRYGLPTELKSTVWENYELGGTQTDFVDGLGLPDMLSDAYIENSFPQSSCITCHSRAGMTVDGRRRSGVNPAIGVPDASKPPFSFVDANGKLQFAQFDFVFSTIRAVPPAGRSKFMDPCLTGGNVK